GIGMGSRDDMDGPASMVGGMVMAGLRPSSMAPSAPAPALPTPTPAPTPVISEEEPDDGSDDMEALAGGKVPAPMPIVGSSPATALPAIGMGGGRSTAWYTRALNSLRHRFSRGRGGVTPPSMASSVPAPALPAPTPVISDDAAVL